MQGNGSGFAVWRRMLCGGVCAASLLTGGCMTVDGQFYWPWDEPQVDNARHEQELRQAQRDAALSRNQVEGLTQTQRALDERLDRLEAAGFVERRSLASDRRQHSIHLTEAGRTMARRAIAAQHKWLSSTLGRLDDTELDALEAQLVRLRDIMREQEAPLAARAAGE